MCCLSLCAALPVSAADMSFEAQRCIEMSKGFTLNFVLAKQFEYNLFDKKNLLTLAPLVNDYCIEAINEDKPDPDLIFSIVATGVILGEVQGHDSWISQGLELEIAEVELIHAVSLYDTDPDSSMMLVSGMAEKDYAPALLVQALMLLSKPDNKNFRRSVRDLLERSASFGYAPAQYFLGRALSDGAFFEQDLLYGKSLLVKAFEQGHSGAGEWLALLCRQTLEDCSDELAFEYMMTAAQAGRPYAQYWISQAYWVGTGTARDTKEANRWSEIAAENGWDSEVGVPSMEELINFDNLFY